jgi:hypothetical protein
VSNTRSSEADHVTNLPPIEQRLSRLDVARYLLQVEFTKLARPPFDPADVEDLVKLIDALPEYHDGPRNSPTHLYAALMDDTLEWGTTSVPAAKLVMGPHDGGLIYEYVEKADAFVDAFVRLLSQERDREEFAEFFRSGDIEYPRIIAILEDYDDSTPFLHGPKEDHGLIYKIKDGYHRTFSMVAQGLRMIPVILGCLPGLKPWKGYYRHLPADDPRRRRPERDTSRPCGESE